MTTTEGHERPERARDRFVLAAKEREDEEPQRKRHHPEVEGSQPLAQSASIVRSNYPEGGSSGSGSALPLPPAPPPLGPPPLVKRWFGTGDRNDRGNRGTTGRIEEAQITLDLTKWDFNKVD